MNFFEKWPFLQPGDGLKSFGLSTQERERYRELVWGLDSKVNDQQKFQNGRHVTS